MEDIDATIDQGFAFAEPVVIAVRGERLALSRMVTRTAAGDESARLSANELDADGRMVRSVLFDDDDLLAALAELDARYLAGEGTPDASTIALGVDLFARINAHDWDAYRDAIDPAFVGADHRELSWPTLDRAGLVEMMRGYADLSADFSMTTRKFVVSGRCLLVVLDVRGTTVDGTAVEWVPYIVLTASDSGRMAGFDMYDEDDFSAALARFDELGAGAPIGPRIANLASRAEHDFAVFVNRGDLGGLRARISEDFVRYDHRRVTGQGTVPGKEAMLENLAALVELGIEVSVLEVVATRGDRLALTSMRFEADGFTTEILELVCVDATGAHASLSNFDDDDLPAALRALDAAYFVGEGEPFQRVLTVCGKFGSVSLREDTAELADLAAPGFAFTDRRLLGYGDGDLQYLLDAGYTGLDRVDGSVVDRVLHLAGSALLTVQRWLAISETGSEFEQVVCFVMHVDDSALVDRLELYDEADFSTALARLDELGRPTPGGTGTSLVENSASRFMERLRTAFNAKDRVALGRLTARGAVHEDRRSIVASVGLDPVGRLVDIEATIDQGFTFAEPVTIAVRGDRLALTRMVTRTAAGDESARLSVNELDADGRLVRSVLFDEEDLVDALAELDRAYYVGEDAAGQRVLRVVGRYAAASAAGDFDEIRANLADDFVVVDRQPLGFGEGDREYFVDMRRLAEPDPELVNRVFRLNEHTLLAVYLSRPVTVTGTQYEHSGVLVMGVDASDRVNRIEMYADDDFEIALTRFEALGAPQDRQHARLENLATRASTRVRWRRSTAGTPGPNAS